MYSSIFVNFLIYVHICSSQIVFLFPHAAHTASFISNSLSRQVHSTKSVELSSSFSRRIFIRRTLHPLHQSVLMLSKLVFSLLFCQIFSFHLFCNNPTNATIILIATCTIIYSSFMMSTRQNISNFRPLLNATQINPTFPKLIPKILFHSHFQKITSNTLPPPLSSWSFFAVPAFKNAHTTGGIQPDGVYL